MELNKINTLDKGFVALIDKSCDHKIISDIQNELFGAHINKELIKIASATMLIKCPLFVQINLSRFGMKIINTAQSGDVEAYVPDISEIKGDTLEDRNRIKEYIEQTTEALLLNNKSMKMDGADEFTSQVVVPISTYNTIIVSGGLEQWLEYLRQTSLPSSVEVYRKVTEDILKADWPIGKLK